MAEYLPTGWRGKRVAVLFNRQDAGGFEATLISDSAGGVTVDYTEGESTRPMFIPWPAVRYVELLEKPSEGATATSSTGMPGEPHGGFGRI